MFKKSIILIGIFILNCLYNDFRPTKRECKYYIESSIIAYLIDVNDKDPKIKENADFWILWGMLNYYQCMSESSYYGLPYLP